MKKLRINIDDFEVRDPTNCVILIFPGTEPVFARSLTEKRGVLTKYRELRLRAAKGKAEPVLIGVWPSIYSSHAFLLTEEKLSECVPTDR